MNRELHTKSGPDAVRALDAPPRARAARGRRLPRGRSSGRGPAQRRRAGRSAWPRASASIPPPRCGCTARASRKSFLPVDAADPRGAAPRRLRRAAGCRHPPADPGAGRAHRVPVDAAAAAGPRRRTRARYREEVLARRKSVLDLLEEFPACQLPFNRVPRDAAAAAPALLLDLVVAAPGRAALQHHGGGGGRPRPLGPRHLPGRLLELPAPPAGGRRRSTPS